MSPGADSEFEKSLEDYVLEKSEPDTRRALDDALNGEPDGPLAEALRFERALVRSLDVAPPPSPTDLVETIEARLKAERTPKPREAFRHDLAQEVLRNLVDSGGVGAGLRPRRRGFIPWASVARAAVVLAVVLGSYWWVLFGGEGAKDADQDATLRVVFDRYENVAKGDRGVRGVAEQSVAFGARVESTEDRAALVRLGRRDQRDGTLLLYPRTVVEFEHGPQPGTIAVRILTGGVRMNVHPSRPIFVTAHESDWARGKFAGQGEIVLVDDDSPTSPAPSTERALFVRVDQAGQASFSNGADGRVELSADEAAVVGPSSAMKMPAESPNASIAAPPSSWSLPNDIAFADEVVMKIGAESITRRQVAREALRLYGGEVVELIVKGIVCQFESAATKIAVDPTLAREIGDIVAADEFLQTAPLRSAEAHAERARQIAAFAGFAEAETSGDRSPTVDRARRLAAAESAWRKLAEGLRLEFHGSGAGGKAFTVHYRGKAAPVTYVEVWESLQRWMRAAEMQGVIDDLARRQVLARYIDGRGERVMLPVVSGSVGAARRRAEAAIARMAGLPLQVALDRRTVLVNAARYIDAPTEAEIARFSKDAASQSQHVLFERFFVPFVEPTQGRRGADFEARAKAAELAAREIVAMLRRGVRPNAPADPTAGIWSWSPDAGPKAWWSEIYGPRFLKAALMLRDGEVTEPVPTPEGFLVAVVVRASGGLTPSDLRVFAREALIAERAQRFVESLVEKAGVVGASAEKLLER